MQFPKKLPNYFKPMTPRHRLILNHEITSAEHHLRMGVKQPPSDIQHREVPKRYAIPHG